MDERAKSYADRAAEYFAANPHGVIPDGMFGRSVIDPELPTFWKPEEVGDRRLGEVQAVRPTKDFGEGRGEAIHLLGPDGLFSIPIGATLKLINWHKQLGRTFLFVFMGWQDLPPVDGEETRCRKWKVLPLKVDRQIDPGGAPAGDEDDVPF